MHVRETPEPHYLASHSTLPRVGGAQTWRRAARPPTPVKSPSLITGAIREGAPHCFLLRTRSASVQANLFQDPPSSASQAVRHVEDLRGRVALEVCGNVMQAARTSSARAYPPGRQLILLPCPCRPGDCLSRTSSPPVASDVSEPWGSHYALTGEKCFLGQSERETFLGSNQCHPTPGPVEETWSYPGHVIFGSWRRLRPWPSRIIYVHQAALITQPVFPG